MPDILQDRYTALGIGHVREKSYNTATRPTVASNDISVHGTRDIVYGLRPDLDGMPKPMIENVEDVDVMNRPWDMPSEIQRVSKMVKVDMTFPRLTLKEAMLLITLALSKRKRVGSGSSTKIMATPRNDADSLDLWSTCITVNSARSAGPDMDGETASKPNRAAATYPDRSSDFDPGVIRAYDGFFVNGFELSLQRGTERLFSLTIDGYASGSYSDAATAEYSSLFYQNHYLGAELSGITAARDFLNSYVDSRIVTPSGTYLRGTDTTAWLAFASSKQPALTDLTPASARRLTSQGFSDRSTEKGTDNLVPTADGGAAGPTLLDLNNLAYDFRLSYSNNVDTEDLLRWGGEDAFTAAEKGLQSLEVSMEFDLQDYSYITKLIDSYEFAFQMVCSPESNQGMGILCPLLRQSENSLARRGVKRTQQITFKPIGKEAGTAPLYMDFRVPTDELEGNTVWAEDTATNEITGRD